MKRVQQAAAADASDNDDEEQEPVQARTVNAFAGLLDSEEEPEELEKPDEEKL